MNRTKLGLVLWILTAFAAAAIGSLYGPGEWYRALNKPSFNPPNWIFAPVWSCLYLLMGIAAWGVWKKNGFCAAHGFWFTQLVLNGLWSWLFFGLHRPDLSFYDILLLNAAITGTTIGFWRIQPWTGGILLPYQAWVLFASVLNYELWRLNPRP